MNAAKCYGIEIAWRNYRSTLDCGSYCEEASPEAKSASKIITLLRDLTDAMKQHERDGFRTP